MAHHRRSLAASGLGALIALGLFGLRGGAQDSAPPRELSRPGSADVGAFVTADACALCHSSSESADAMRDADGGSVAPHDLWRSSMMAQSARDPLWRAQVSAELAAAPPKRRPAIAAKCLRCHAPMASVLAAKNKEPTPSFGLLYQEGARGRLARDGVSCTVCHQIEDRELGSEKSFSGRFIINDELKIYGPHADPFWMPMRRHSGYFATEAQHIRESKLCASCHTLFTEALSKDGEPSGQKLPEQTPYLEWRNSVFSTEAEDAGDEARSCQDCHVPSSDARGRPLITAIARNPRGFDFGPVEPRRPFGRHVFVGANTVVPAILRDHADVLRPGAPKAAFDATIAAAREQLQKRSARLWIGPPKRDGERLSIPVKVENLVGHKLPSGIPLRRLWLRLEVRDRNGRLVFRSGGVDGQGRLVDLDGRALASEKRGGPVQPHHQRIRASSQVQVYEAVMGDVDGRPTGLLLRGATFLKDNRLLPRGWDPKAKEARVIGPVGVDRDGDFIGGADRLSYELTAPKSAGPYSIKAALLYQILGARHAAEALRFPTPEIRDFQRFYRPARRRPELVAEAEARSP